MALHKSFLSSPEALLLGELSSERETERFYLCTSLFQLSAGSLPFYGRAGSCFGSAPALCRGRRAAPRTAGHFRSDSYFRSRRARPCFRSRRGCGRCSRTAAAARRSILPVGHEALIPRSFHFSIVPPPEMICQPFFFASDFLFPQSVVYYFIMKFRRHRPP